MRHMMIVEDILDGVIKILSTVTIQLVETQLGLLQMPFGDIFAVGDQLRKGRIFELNDPHNYEKKNWAFVRNCIFDRK